MPDPTSSSSVPSDLTCNQEPTERCFKGSLGPLTLGECDEF